MGQTGGKAQMAEQEQFADQDKLSFVLDASKGGCTGMFWRSRPEMGATVQANDWPRNGTPLKGWLSKAHPGWVRIDHPQGYWMPVSQHGHDVMHQQ